MHSSLQLLLVALSLPGEIQTVVRVVVALPWVTLPSTTTEADILGTKIISEIKVQVRAYIEAGTAVCTFTQFD